MTSILSRRSLLRGLFAMPAVVAASSLMPVRGIIQPIELPYVIDAPGAVFVPVTLEEIRNLLLPCLFDFRYSYSNIPRDWENIFKDAA